MVHHPHHRRKLVGGYFTDMTASPRISPSTPSTPLVVDPFPAVIIHAGSSSSDSSSSSRTDIQGPMLQLVNSCDVDTQHRLEREATRTTTTTTKLTTTKSALDPLACRWDGRLDGPIDDGPTGHHQVGEEEEVDELWMVDDKVDPLSPPASTLSSSFSLSSQSWSSSSSSSFSSLMVLSPHKSDNYRNDDDDEGNIDNNNNGSHYNGRIRLLRDHVTEHARQRRDRRHNRRRRNHHHSLRISPAAPSTTSTTIATTSTSTITTMLGTSTPVHTTLPLDTVSAASTTSTARQRRPRPLQTPIGAVASASSKYLAERVLRLIAEENAAFYRAMVDHLLLHNHRHHPSSSSKSSSSSVLSSTAMASAPLSPSSSLSPIPSLIRSPAGPSVPTVYHHHQLSPRGVQDEFWSVMWEGKKTSRAMLTAATTITTTRGGTIVGTDSIPSPLTIPSLPPSSPSSSSLLLLSATTLPGGLSSLSRKRRMKTKTATTKTSTMLEDHGGSCDGLIPWMVPNLVETKEGEYTMMKPPSTDVKTSRPMSSDMPSFDSHQVLFPHAKNADVDASSELAACDGYVRNPYYHEYDDEEGTWIWLDDDPICHPPTVEDDEEEGCCTVVSTNVVDKHLDNDGMAMTMSYPSSIVATSSTPLFSKIGDNKSDNLLPSLGTAITVPNQHDGNNSSNNGDGNNIVMSLAHNVFQGLCGWSKDHIPSIMGHIVGWAETVVHGQHRQDHEATQVSTMIP